MMVADVSKSETDGAEQAAALATMRALVRELLAVADVRLASGEDRMVVVAALVALLVGQGKLAGLSGVSVLAQVAEHWWTQEEPP